MVLINIDKEAGCLCHCVGWFVDPCIGQTYDLIVESAAETKEQMNGLRSFHHENTIWT